MGVVGCYMGDMYIPEKQREKFAGQVIKLLNYGGMMQLEEISMYGHEMALLKPIHIYPGGNVEFYYNYFEDDEWETAEFRSEDAFFFSDRIGYAEFNDVIMAIYALYDVYDESVGFASENGEVSDISRYVGWINQILGTEFSMCKRYRLWDNIEQLVFWGAKRYDRWCTVDEIIDFIPEGKRRYVTNSTEFKDIIYIIRGTDILTPEEMEMGTYPADVYQCKRALKLFFDKNDEKEAINRVLNLIRMDRNARKIIEDTALSDIAEMTLIMPARVIVYLMAELKGLDFWKLWQEIYETVYQDHIMRKYESDALLEERQKAAREPIPPLRTSEFLRQDRKFTFHNTPEELQGKPNYYISDDDRLYWWDGTDEVRISETMEQWLKALALQHKKIVNNLSGIKIKEDESRNLFLRLLAEIDQYYECIYPFQSMFYEFLHNAGKEQYRAAVELLRSISEENKENGKIIEKAKYGWVSASRNVTHNIGRLRLKRYLSVMANLKLRKRYFGF